jgi:adenine C2-methylase RlmN of 23S rRNA A2503 and tRNA A37
MEVVKTIEMKCGQAYVAAIGPGRLLEMGDVFLPNENALGTRPYRFSDFGAVSDSNKRVMTICTMLGCCGGCTFCSVRKSFKRNLSKDEILGQVDFLLKAGAAFGRAPSPLSSREFHVLYSRMGEPSLNMKNVIDSIYELAARYPHVRIGLSSAGWKRGLQKLLAHPEIAKHIMLQFSAHGTDEAGRSRLLGAKTGRGLMTLQEMAGFVREFRKLNSRKVSLNFILLRDQAYDFRKLAGIFRAEDVYIRLSPLNVTGNSNDDGLEGLLLEEDVLQKAPLSSPELKNVIRDLEQSGLAYAYAPAIDEEIRNQAACGQALETLKSERLITFKEAA